MTNLIDQANRALARELAGYQPVIDQHDRSVLELLEMIDGCAEEIGVNEDAKDSAIEISFLVSMIRVKLGFPATVHTTSMAKTGGAA